MQKVMGRYHTYSISGKTAALVPDFAEKSCLQQNCTLGSSACSEGPALGQNTLLLMMMIIHENDNLICYLTIFIKKLRKMKNCFKKIRIACFFFILGKYIYLFNLCFSVHQRLRSMAPITNG